MKTIAKRNLGEKRGISIWQRNREMICHRKPQKGVEAKDWHKREKKGDFLTLNPL
jgi:hypothetical protein